MRLHSHADLDDPFRSKWRDHIDQCIELLRHKLMCDGDTTPNLMKTTAHIASGEKPDLGIKHKCRDYQRVLDWANENAWGL